MAEWLNESLLFQACGGHCSSQNSKVIGLNPRIGPNSKALFASYEGAIMPN